MRQAELQVPTKTSTSQPTSSPIDKFPPYEETIDTVGSSRPNASPSVKYAPSETWEPRQSFYSREHANDSVRNPKHRPRKSISEAITTIRTRNGSVSANAQELAEALRAPVSYRLIVCQENRRTAFSQGKFANVGLGPLPRLVLDLRPHQHVLEVHLERSSHAHHLDHRSICICFILVFAVGVPIQDDTVVATERAGS